MFLKNIRSGSATASECVYRLDQRAGSILTSDVVKHEQKKKDKTSRLLKEIESETRDAVNLVCPSPCFMLITRLQTRDKILQIQSLWDEVLVFLSIPTERGTDILQGRSFPPIRAGLCRKRR